MKRNNALKVVLATIAVLVVITWICPTAYFQESYAAQKELAQIGLFNLFNYPTTALSYFGFVAVYVLVVGGFYGVLEKTGAYRILLDKMVSMTKGKEKIILPVIMAVLAIITSVCGLQLPLLAVFPFIISLVLLMGYDKKTAATVTVGSVVVGLIGTTIAYNVTGILTQILSTKMFYMPFFSKSLDEIFSNPNFYVTVVKMLLVIIGLVLLIVETILHMNKIEKSKEKETEKTVKDYVPEKVKSNTKNAKKKSVWPLILVLDLIILIMILSFIPWNDVFKLDIFTKATTNVTEFSLSKIPVVGKFLLNTIGQADIIETCLKFPIFGKILGEVNAFGSWTLTELSLVLIIASIIIALIYKIKFNDYVQTMLTGARKMLRPALIIVLIYTCLVITTYHPFQLVIYHWFFKLTEGFNIATTTIVAGLAGIFNVEPTYAFQSAVPYLQSLVSDKSTYPLIGLIFQSMYGLAMLVAPTSVVLMTTLSYLNISYKDWLKHIWRLALELLVGLVIIFTILLLITGGM